MRIGITLREPSGPDVFAKLHEQVQRVAEDGLASAWMSNSAWTR